MLTRRTLLFSSFAAAACLAPGGKRKVQSLLYQDQNGSVEISPAVTTVRPFTGQRSFPRASVGETLYPRQYANDALNSRLSASVPRRVYRLRWQSPVNPTFPPQFVLLDDGRIVIQTAEWQLFDREGKPVAADRLGLGHAVIDAGAGLLYVVNIAGFVAGRKLSDGVQSFNFLPRFGDSFARTFLGRRGQQMLIAGVERPRGAHGDFEPSRSIIEIVDLGQPLRVDDMGNLASADPKASLILPSLTALVAGANDKLTIAIPNSLYIVDWNLKVQSAFAFPFEPVSMSLDEAGRIWLVATVEGRSHLMMLSPAGEQFFDIDITGISLVQPPIIGYDHTAYLVGREKLMAIGVDGKVKWSKSTAGTGYGATVTPDDSLLASEGNAVTLLNPAGERRRVFASPDGDLVTPPILTESSDILVASASKLYCLTFDE